MAKEREREKETEMDGLLLLDKNVFLLVFFPRRVITIISASPNPLP